MCVDVVPRDADGPPHSVERQDSEGVMIRGILWYQRLREGRPSPCRFFPSCSEYALEAVRSHGSRRGGWLAIRRLLRCRPFGPSGFDPVPDAPTGPVESSGLEGKSDV